jgi:hypothetical protein
MSMKKPWPLLALGIGAFLILALITLPASVVLSFVHPANVTLSGVSGTIWKGRAPGRAQRHGARRQRRMGSRTRLRCSLANSVADVKVARTDGFAQGSDLRGRRRPTDTAQVQRIAASQRVAAEHRARRLDRHLSTCSSPSSRSSNSWPVALNGTDRRR